MWDWRENLNLEFCVLNLLVWLYCHWKEFLTFFFSFYWWWLIDNVCFIYRARGPQAMESMVEENGSAVDPLASPGSQSGDSAPAIASSVQSLNRNQQQTHHLVASTSIVHLTLPSSGTTQVHARIIDSCCTFLTFAKQLYKLFLLCSHIFFSSSLLLFIY